MEYGGDDAGGLVLADGVELVERGVDRWTGVGVDNLAVLGGVLGLDGSFRDVVTSVDVDSGLLDGRFGAAELLEDAEIVVVLALHAPRAGTVASKLKAQS